MIRRASDWLNRYRGVPGSLTVRSFVSHTPQIGTGSYYLSTSSCCVRALTVSTFLNIRKTVLLQTGIRK